MAESLTAATARRNVQNALSLASIASQQSNLTVQFGEHWCFNWLDRVIEIPEQDLISKPWEHNVWVVLHEAAHVAITRYHLLTADHHKKRNDILFLLNAIEDIRIERWIVDRYPGSAGWRNIAYADAHNRVCTPTAKANAANAFIEAVYFCGQNLPLPEGLHPTGLAAATLVKDAVNRVAEARPQGGIVGTAQAREQLKKLAPLSLVEKTKLQLASFNSQLDRVSLLSQLEAWRIIQKEILPVYYRLVEEHGHPCVPKNFVPSSGIAASASSRPTRVAPHQRPGQHTPVQHRAPDLQHSYTEIVTQHSALIDRICNVLIENMRLNRSLEYVTNLSHGDRVHMPAALQFAADRRRYNSLWARRNRPTTPEPAFLFAIDISESMQREGRARNCLESMIVMREVCLRTRIAHSITTFNAEPTLLIDWDTPDSPDARQSIVSIGRPNGGTNLVAALQSCNDCIAPRTERDRHLWILTDAELPPNAHEASKTTIESLSQDGVHIHGLGFGTASDNLQLIIPTASTNVAPESLCEIIHAFIVNAATQAA
jgi:hypothetical protein